VRIAVLSSFSWPAVEARGRGEMAWSVARMSGSRPAEVAGGRSACKLRPLVLILDGVVGVLSIPFDLVAAEVSWSGGWQELVVPEVFLKRIRRKLPSDGIWCRRYPWPMGPLRAS